MNSSLAEDRGWRAFIRRHGLIAVWGVGVLLYATDFLVKKLPVWREPFNVWVPFDDVIPFRAAWAWVYIFAWLVLMFAFAGWYVLERRDRWGDVRALMIAVVVMQVCGWIFLFAVPTYFPRPELSPELLEASLIGRIFEVDPPVHKLPSLHVASITIAAWYFCRDAGWWRWVLGVGAVVLISLSTMYIKQHGIIDVVAGVGWGWAAALVGLRWSRSVDRRRASRQAGSVARDVTGDGADAGRRPKRRHLVDS